MANNTVKTTFDKQKYQELKNGYNLAIRTNKKQFTFYGEVLLTSYAKHLIEYLKPLVK